jgi:hypothetical protein
VSCAFADYHRSSSVVAVAVTVAVGTVGGTAARA